MRVSISLVSLRNRKALFAFSACACLSLVLSGCGLGAAGTTTAATPIAPIATTPVVPAPKAGSGISGVAFGGQQAVSGAVVTLWAAGSTGYGLGATSIATTTTSTDGNGTFNLNVGGGSSTTQACTTGQSIYITITGGNPGGGANSSSALMAALPSPCSAATGTTFVEVNEVTTVASVWALQQFMSITPSGSPAWNIGAPSTNQVGLKNAFASVAQLVNISTGVSGVSTIANTINSTTTYTNTITPDFNRVNLVADILSTCINSTSASSSIAITGWSIASGVATFTATNALSAGNYVTLSGFVPSNSAGYFNGQTLQVIATGLSTTQFEANIVPTNTDSGSDTGNATQTNSGGISTLCNSLFTDVTPTSGGTNPTDTIQAAYDIASAPAGITRSGTSMSTHSLASWGYYMCSQYVLPSPPFATTTPCASTGVPYDFQIGTSWKVGDTTPADQISVTAWSTSGSAVTFTGANSLVVGQNVTMSGFTAVTALNTSFTTTAVTSTSFTASSSIAANSGTDPGTGTPNITTDYASVAIDASGNIWTDQEKLGLPPIIEFDPTGRVLQVIPAGNQTAPASTIKYFLPNSTSGVTYSPTATSTPLAFNTNFGLAIDTSGNAWVTNSSGGTYTNNGTFYAGMLVKLAPATITSSTTSTSSTPVPYVTGGSPGPIAIDGENNLWVGIVPTSTATGALALQTSASNYLNIYENQIEQNTHAFDDIVVDGSTSHLAVGFDSYTTTSGYFYRSSIATATTSTNLGSANLLDVGGPTALGTLWGTVDASNNIWVGEGTRGTGSIAHYVPNAATPISITACSSSGVNLTFTYSGTQLLKGEYVVPTGLTGAICSTANGLALVVRSTSLSATVFTAVNPTGGTGTQANVTGLTATGTQSTETITTGSIAAGTGSTAAGGIDDPASISIDGGGFVWIGNATTASGTTGGISEFTPSGTTAISPTLGTAVASVEGFNADGSTGVQDVTIDLSGNIWTGSNNSTFIHMFGAAEPVICPTSVATTSGVFPVASYSIDGSNNITVTFTNTLTSAFNTSDVISLSAFGTSTFLNGATLTVASASTTSATGVLSVTHATTSGTITEAGNTVDFTQPGRLGTRP